MNSKKIKCLLIVAITFFFYENFIVPIPVNGQPITLKFASMGPPGTFPCIDMEWWAKEVEKRTNGKVKVQTFPVGTLMAPKNIFDGVISGLADIGNFSASYQPGRFPVTESIGLPVSFSNARVGSHVAYDIIEKYNPKEYERVKIINICTNPGFNICTKIPVKTLKDLKGIEMRTTAEGIGIVKLLGATPIAMPQSETPEALQKGIVKGHFSALETLKDFKFAAYTPYVLRFNIFAASMTTVMNKEIWESLPSDVKKVIDDMKLEQMLRISKYLDDRVIESIEWSKKEYNLQMFELSPDEKAELPKLFKPIIDSYIQKVNALGLPGDQIVKDILSLRDKYEKQYK